jgi:3-deoxy-D-manno-octulosonic acid kinase
MNPVVQKDPSMAIIYDASKMEAPAAETFTPEYWAARNALQGEAIGRGSAWFVDMPFGPVVLRQYLRGGWAAKLSRSAYFFTTVARSRPFREFNVLASLHGLDLPVPRPLAALCEHHGLLSSGALMTARIEGAQTLADLLPGDETAVELWADVGKCIRRFHQAGVWHADLNARNILLDAESRVFLIDFDRARFTPGKAVNGENNLARLNRSLVKLWPASKASKLQPAWDYLMEAYHA